MNSACANNLARAERRTQVNTYALHPLSSYVWQLASTGSLQEGHDPPSQLRPRALQQLQQG